MRTGGGGGDTFPGFDILSSCLLAFPLFPKEENFKLLVEETISCASLTSMDGWMTGTIPSVVAPRLSCGILLGDSIFLLLMVFSHPSTTLWDGFEPSVLGIRGALLLVPAFLAGIPLIPFFTSLDEELELEVKEDSNELSTRCHGSGMQSCLGGSRLQLLLELVPLILLLWAIDEVGFNFLERLHWTT